MSKEFSAVCRRAGNEGIVLLKNDHQTLPLKKGTKVSVFGRIQTHYIKSGTGSGGLVNVSYVVGIPEGLSAEGLVLNEELAELYRSWEQENPFDVGGGWAKEPWAQVEMPLTDEAVKRASEASEAAIVIIGRTAGEEKDNSNVEESYLLSQTERDMLRRVTAHFDKVIVILNVGNIIDMKWVAEFNPAAVLYAWQGGQEGGNAVADVIVGNVSPSGKLTDTIAYDVTDYPSHPYFGDRHKNVYTEDIYVGYRYFCTFAREKALYPFGYGLSYTTFAYADFTVEKAEDTVTVSLTVTNTGAYTGKEVVQVYLQAPQGKLGKPERVLAAYAKTKALAPGQTEALTIRFALSDFASFDDLNETGYANCFVLEQGEYGVCVSRDAMTDLYRDAFTLEADIVVQQCAGAMWPVEDIERFKPALRNGRYEVSFQNVMGRPNDLRAKIDAGTPAQIPYTGDLGIKLVDVRDGKATMEAFIAQFSDEDLAVIAFGEGMNSPKVTGGTGCAFGGLSESLLKKGVPIACGTDGPSGLRMDCGAKGTSMPNGTMLACTWNEALLEELFTWEGKEMNENNIDVLLGPGMNIHRHPLCGRNFEYLSEDPLLSGRMAYAMCAGMANAGTSGTIKHLCANNQETNRHNLDSVVSQRALREIYLKPFEIAVRMGDACKAVMTSYNPVNGTWTSGHYDLTTTILREDWGYTGFVMSDWWCRTKLEEFDRYHGKINQGERDYIPCVEAQNDIYMCCKNSADFKNLNVYDSLVSGRVARGFAQRNAMNVCRFLMHSTAMERYLAMSEESMKAMLGAFEKGELLLESRESEAVFLCRQAGTYILCADIASTGSQLSQNTAIFYANGEYVTSFTVAGSNGTVTENAKRITLTEGENRITVKYPKDALSIAKLSIYAEKG